MAGVVVVVGGRVVALEVDRVEMVEDILVVICGDAVVLVV